MHKYLLSKRQKKASLEISIQAIVIVVLAMTLLGLGLVFIKNMFGNIDILAGGTFDKIQDQLQRDLVNGNERLVFSQTKLTMERGSSNLFGWGAKNDGSTRLSYWAEFKPIKCPQSDCPTLEELNEEWFSFKYNPTGDLDLAYELGPANNHVIRADLAIPKDAIPGLYLIDLTIYDLDAPIGDDRFASTDIFLTVT